MKEIAEIYGQMLETFEEKTGFAMDDTADLAVRLYAAAAQLQALYIYADWALTQSFPQCAAGQYLDYHAQLRGITRKGGHKAEGVLRFRLESARPDALTIPAGVVCTTAGLVRFVTTEEGVIPAGALYADVAAEAESVGTAGNVPAQSVTFLTKAPTGVSGVTNPAAFQGGSGDEDDESLRERILDSFLRLPNGANAVFYELRALSHKGVDAVRVIPRDRGIGTVGVVVAEAGAAGRDPAGSGQRARDRRGCAGDGAGASKRGCDGEALAEAENQLRGRLRRCADGAAGVFHRQPARQGRLPRTARKGRP